MRPEKFGQYVKLTVQNTQGGLVFESDTLRIDFDVRHLDGFSRCKIDVYNLSTKTIKDISNGKNYATIVVALHDGDKSTIVKHFFISNAIEVPNAPHSITSLYTFSSIKSENLEKQISIIIRKPTLKKSVEALALESGFKGRIIYKNFPPTMLTAGQPKPIKHLVGSFEDCLKSLSRQYGFNSYTEDNRLVLVYKPNIRNVEGTDMYKSTGDIKLSTRDMMANPKIGPATLNIRANLNANIKPGVILDTSNLLYAAVDIDQATLEISEKFIKEKIAGFSKYLTLSVKHKGSNFHDVWETEAMATSPTPGTNMPIATWFK